MDVGWGGVMSYVCSFFFFFKVLLISFSSLMAFKLYVFNVLNVPALISIEWLITIYQKLTIPCHMCLINK